MRRVHSFAGLAAALVVTFMAITGAILSLQPAIETVAAKAWSGLANVGELAGAVSTALPGVERVTRSPSGMIVAYYADGGSNQAAQIDPATGSVVGPYEPPAFFSFITELHRSLFLGESGHAVAGVASVAIALLAASGIFLLVARMGGWRRLFGRVKGMGTQKLHSYLARIAILGLVVTSLSGAYMSAVNFGFVPDGSSLGFDAIPESTGAVPAAVDSLQALTATPLSDLREIVFPAAGDAADVFTITTAQGQGYVDQSTGAMLSFTVNNFWQQLYEAIYVLHTGEGVWWFALVLGAFALAVPAMAISGVAIWYQRRRNSDRLRDNSSWRAARTVILVGTENSTTMGFAATLHAALVEGGERVHTGPMNSIRAYPNAQRVIVLTATYGDGGAPASANHFLAHLRKLPTAPAASYAVLGFGDRSFSNYCAFAEAVDAALAATGSTPLLDLGTIDRQSGQDFAQWGRRLGEILGKPLALSHTPARPAAHGLVLVERADFGREVQAPTAILRFVAPEAKSWLARFGIKPRLPRFSVGDLVGILPPGSLVPRYYSLASASREGVLEICVRKQAGGVCSEFLHALSPGEHVEAFIRHNPDFRPAHSKKPLILIGAGSGIAPLAGFVRQNRRKRPTYLFFGARDPASDFLYETELRSAIDDRRLTGLDAAFSRIVGGQYVQERLVAQAELLRRQVEAGAQVMVCGGLEMARGVRATLDTVLAPLGLTTSMLKAQGRYLEDAY